MATSFAVTTSSGSVRLDSERRSAVSYTVTNRSGRDCRGRVAVVPLHGAGPQWFTIRGDVERHFAVEQTHHFLVEIGVPAGAPAGAYSLRLDVVSEDNPDEDYAQGPAVAFAVSESIAPVQPEPDGYLRTIAGAATGGLIGLAASILLAFAVGALLLGRAEDPGEIIGAVIIAFLLLFPGPWIGAVMGSAVALSLGGYRGVLTTGLLMAVVFPVWTVFNLILLAHLPDLGGPFLLLITILFIVPSAVVLPSVAARFGALQWVGRRPAGLSRDRPVTT